KALQARFGPRLRFVFRNMPLTNAHPQAEIAAEAAEAAALQGKFWPMHDLLYEHQAELGPEFVLRAATGLRLDVDAFKEAIEAGQVRGRVHHDFTDGVRSGVNGTPTFFLNGTRFDDSWDEETLGAAIENAIAGRAPAKVARARPAKQTPR